MFGAHPRPALLMVLVAACGAPPPPPPPTPVVVEATDARPAGRDVPAPPGHARLGPPWHCPLQREMDFVGYWPQCPAYWPLNGLVGLCPDGDRCQRPCRSVAYEFSGSVEGEASVFEARYTYDAQGRLTSTTLRGPYGNRREAVQPCAHEPGGCAEHKTFEAGRLIETRHEGGITRYDYDEQGRLVAVTPGPEEPVKLTYDDAGRLQSIGGSVLSYDDAGRLVSDDQYLTPTFTYDEAGRVVRREGGVMPLTSTFDYDGEGHLIRETRRTSYGDGFLVGMTHYFYTCRASDVDRESERRP